MVSLSRELVVGILRVHKYLSLWTNYVKIDFSQKSDSVREQSCVVINLHLCGGSKNLLSVSPDSLGEMAHNVKAPRNGGRIESTF